MSSTKILSIFTLVQSVLLVHAVSHEKFRPISPSSPSRLYTRLERNVRAYIQQQQEENRPLTTAEAESYLRDAIKKTALTYKTDSDPEATLLQEILFFQITHERATALYCGTTPAPWTKRTISDKVNRTLRFIQVLTITNDVKYLFQLTAEEFARHKEECIQSSREIFERFNELNRTSTQQ